MLIRYRSDRLRRQMYRRIRWVVAERRMARLEGTVGTASDPEVLSGQSLTTSNEGTVIAG